MQTVSWSELSDARQCPFKHQLSYRERWSAPSDGTNALAKGSCYHLVMEAHFRALLETQDDPDATTADRLAFAVSRAQERIDLMRDQKEFPEETIQLIEWMYVGYVERYGIDEDWRIMAVETTHIVPFYEPIANTGEWQIADDFNLKIKVDVAVTDKRDRLWIVDHKSAGKLPGSDRDYQFADQFGLYHYGFVQLGYRVTGTIHNGNLTKMNKGDIYREGDPEWKSTMKPTNPDTRFKRVFMDRTDHELRMIQWEALRTFRKAYADPDPERHPDEERCRWKCQFNDACNLGRRTGDIHVRPYLMDTGFTQDYTRN